MPFRPFHPGRRREHRAEVHLSEVVRGSGEDYRAWVVTVAVRLELDGRDCCPLAAEVGTTEEGERIALTDNERSRAEDEAAERWRENGDD